MNISEIDILVSELNFNFAMSADFIGPFTVSTDGVTVIVEFCGQSIWDDDNDEREEIDEDGTREELEIFLIRKASSLVCRLMDFVNVCEAKTKEES